MRGEGEIRVTQIEFPKNENMTISAANIEQFDELLLKIAILKSIIMENKIL